MDIHTMLLRKAQGKERHNHHEPNGLVPDYRSLGRSMLLVFAILSLPLLLRAIPGFFQSGANTGTLIVDPASIQMKPEELIPIVFKDLLEKRLLMPGEKVFLIGGDSASDAIINGIRRFMDQGVIPPLDIIWVIPSGKKTADFIFAADGYESAAPWIERVLTVGGIALLRFSSQSRDDPFRVPPLYEIVYLRRFNSPVASEIVPAISETVPAAHETQAAAIPNDDHDQIAPRRPGLCPMLTAKKWQALRQLEDVLLEPPRDAWVQSRSYMKHVEYLPDLMGDDLRSYSRHVYVEVGSRSGRGIHGGGVGQWFRESYPSHGRNFDVYALEGDAAGKYTSTVTWARKQLSRSATASSGGTGLSEWLQSNVAAEEYVVMKVDVGGGREFELVREMVKTKAVCLVDELFLVCDHEGKGGGRRNGGSRRAYWECLSLYGLLREEGVAVHQWWS